MSARSKPRSKDGTAEGNNKVDKLTPDLHPEYWYIHGNAYDLSKFIEHHPGGPRALLISRGRDCTEMFESYHSLTDRPKDVMKKFLVGPQDDYSPFFNWTDPAINGFQNELREEVRKFVKDTRLDTKCSYFRMLQFSILFVLTFWFTVKFYWVDATWWAAILTPIFWWTVFVNTFHDASHFAMSRNLWVTHFWTYVYPWFSSPTTWDHQHVIAHHVHTNIPKLDPDLNHGMPIFRINTKFHWREWFRFQIYWTWLVWGVATLWLSNVYDVHGILTGKYHGVLPYQKFSRGRLAWHVFGRVSALFLTIGIPFILFPAGKAIAWALSFNFIFSFCFMACTQVNHLSEECMGHRAQNNPSWSVHQVKTAQAFAHDSYFWWVFAGGLNYQVEHHLFPGINHEHLPLLKPIVIRLCQKYNIPYDYTESWTELFWKYVDVVRIGAKNHHSSQSVSSAPQPTTKC